MVGWVLLVEGLLSYVDHKIKDDSHKTLHGVGDKHNHYKEMMISLST